LNTGTLRWDRTGANFRVLTQEARVAMVGHLAMHGGNRIRTIEILYEAKDVGIADVAIRLDQLTTEQIELRTAKRVHGDTPYFSANKEIGNRSKGRSSGEPSHFTHP
jgi:hypothetical protein